MYCLHLFQDKATSSPAASHPSGGSDSDDKKTEEESLLVEEDEQVSLIKEKKGEKEEGEGYSSTAVDTPSSPQPHHEGAGTNQEVIHVLISTPILYTL